MAETNFNLAAEERRAVRPDIPEHRKSSNLGNNTAQVPSGASSNPSHSDNVPLPSTAVGDNLSTPANVISNQQQARGTVSGTLRGASGELKNFLWSTSRRRKSTIGGGILGLLIGGGIFGMTIISGPLEFIHLAQLMEKFHFSRQENAQNNRLEKIVRYAKNYNKPERTRMGIVGNAVADKLEAKIHDATGLSPNYDSSGRFKGYIADPTHSEYKGKSIEQMKAKMAESLNVEVGSIEVVASKSGVSVPRYNPDSGGINSVKNYRNQLGTARGLFTQAGFNNISAHVGARVLKTRAGWTFHPIKKLDAAYQAQLFKGGKTAIDKFKEKFNNQEKSFVAGDTTAPPIPGETSTAQDNNGKTIADPNKAAAASGGADTQANPSEKNIKAKLAGGGVVLVGALCIMKGVNDKIPELREAKVVLPMMRLAGQFVSIGSQIQSGQDIDMTQLGLYKQFLDGTDSNGRATAWNQAKSIQAELGGPPTGPDIPTNAQVFNSGLPFPFLSEAPLGSVLGKACDILSSPVALLAQAVVAPVATLFQSLVVGPALDSLVSDAAGWLSGVPIDIIKGSGAVDGNYINYGSRLAANEQFASAGGVQLSSGQELALRDTNNSLDTTAFQNKSIAYRILNLHDDQTLASKLTDSLSTQGSIPQSFASMVGGFGNIMANTIKNTSVLLGLTVKVGASQQPYDYHGLKALGFNVNDLASQDYQNPFENACMVTGGQATDGHGCSSPTGILGDPNSPNQVYLDRVQKCFGDTISPNNGNWDINFNSSQPVKSYSDDYKGYGCDDTDPNWTRVRFWIMDTQTIESYDCYAGNTQTAQDSCANVGVSNNSSAAPITTPNTPASSTIDEAHLYDDSSSIACGTNTTDVGVQDGYKTGLKVHIRLCAIPNLPSSGDEANGKYGISGGNGHCLLNSRVSEAVYAMVEAAKKDGITLTTKSCFRTMTHQQELWVQYGQDPQRVAVPGTSNHQMGLAMDFDNVGGATAAPGSGPTWDWLAQHAGNYGYKNYPAEAWHWSPSGN